MRSSAARKLQPTGAGAGATAERSRRYRTTRRPGPLFLNSKDQGRERNFRDCWKHPRGPFSEKPARWILQHLKKRERVDARLLDLRDFPMPFFDQPVTPATPGRPAFAHEIVQKWTAAIAQSDGFVFVTPEYNYGPPRGCSRTPSIGCIRSGIASRFA